MRLLWIPNILTGLRILIALVFPFIPPQFRIWILILALITEYSDGMLARKYNWLTSLGQILDPIADKLLALSVGLSFVFIDKLTLSQLIFISVRDIVAAISFLAIVLIFKQYKMMQNFRVNFFGKITTAFQYFVFFDVLLVSPPDAWLIYLTGTLSLIAAGFYTFKFLASTKKLD